MPLSLPAFMIDWSDLLSALALYLVLEGVLPFLSPEGSRRAFKRMSELSNTSLRIAGIVSMLLGLGLLYAARHRL